MKEEIGGYDAGNSEARWRGHTNFYIYRLLLKPTGWCEYDSEGVSVGDELEYADDITLGRSIGASNHPALHLSERIILVVRRTFTETGTYIQLLGQVFTRPMKWRMFSRELIREMNKQGVDPL